MWFFKIKESICNIPKKAANISNILSRPSVSNGLIINKLKWNLKYNGYVYFEPVRPHTMYQMFAYLKSHNKLYEEISVKVYLYKGSFKWGYVQVFRY